MDPPLLANLGEAERREVLARSRRRVFGRGEVVFHRGDPADSLHWVVKGHFVVRIVTPLGDTVALSVLSAGSVFGELALMGELEPRSATVSALEPGETRSLDKVSFEALRAAAPRTERLLSEALAGQVTRLSERLVEALHIPAESRLLRRLDELAGVYPESGGRVVIPLTQDDLAALAGTTRVTANRILREAQAAGAITLGRGRTVIEDRVAVQRLAGRAPAR